MSMNIIIQEKRKALGLTQEQVADYLGVSVPAVSKWEKGITSPDIGLLPPLARLLKIDLNTLFCFKEDMSQQEIGQFCRELATLAEEDIVSAFELAESKVHEFPHNEQLLIQVTIILDSMLLQVTSLDVPKERYEDKVSDWYSALGHSTDEIIKNSANYMRVSRYIRQDKLAEAQEILDTIQDRNVIISTLPDKLMLQVSIYLKQGKAELAALELEKAVYREAIRIQLLLSKLVEAELAAGEIAIAEKIADKAKDMVDLFDMWKYGGYTAVSQIATQEKNVEKILLLLEQMLEALDEPWRPDESAIYHRMAPETKKMDVREIRTTIIKALETDPECEYFREHPKCKKLLAKYRELQ